jgi:hypothetical protein
LLLVELLNGSTTAPREETDEDDLAPAQKDDWF